VVYVTWFGAWEYSRWYGYNLPTEAQWEFAAGGGIVGTRHGVSQQYAGTNDSDSLQYYAWYVANSYIFGESHPDYGTHKVATKLPNQLGLYDMSGNVFEWCLDWYKGDYYQDCANKPEPPLDPVNNPESSSDRVLRGGSWDDDAENCRMAYRYDSTPGYYWGGRGFRVSLCLQF